MRSIMKSERQVILEWMIDMERWISFLLGIACIAAFLWSIFDGHKAFALHNYSHLSRSIVISLGWLLTELVGYLGLTLIQFAFHVPSEPKAGEQSTSDTVRKPAGKTPDPVHGMKLLVAKRARG